MNKQICQKCGNVIANDFNQTLSFCTSCGKNINLSTQTDNTIPLANAENLYSPTPQNFNAKSDGKSFYYFFGCIGLLGAMIVFSAVGFFVYWWWSANKSQETGKIVKPTSQTVRFITNEPESLDPHQNGSKPIISNALFDGLAEYNNKNSDLTPSLATKWEKNADATIWTFYLRKDAKWTDGKPITANDFVYSWKRLLNPEEKGFLEAFLLYGIKNAELYNTKKAKVDDVGVRAVDDHTLEVTMEKPIPYFDKLIGLKAFRPVPQSAIEKFGSEWTKPENIVTSGAFKLVETSPKNQTVVERNPQFWNNPDTKLEKIVFISYDKVPAGSDYPEKTFKRYENGETDAVLIMSSPDETTKNRKDFTPKKNENTIFLNLNTTVKPFSDVRVRRAFGLAIDREQLKEKNLSRFPRVSFIPEIKGYENAGNGGYQPVEARRLLAEAGYPNGQNFPEIEYIHPGLTNDLKVAEFIKSQWQKELNVSVRLIELDFKDFVKESNSLKYKGVARGFMAGDYDDPFNYLSIFLTEKNGFDTGWTDKKYAAMIEKSNLETDEIKRYKLLNEAETYLLEQQPVIPLYNLGSGLLCQPFIKNLSPNPLGFINWREVYVDLD